MQLIRMPHAAIAETSRAFPFGVGLAGMIAAGFLLCGCGKIRVVERDADRKVISVCELSRDFASFNNKLVTVRGVYYFGLRQECPQKCSIGYPEWPSALELKDSEHHESGEAPVKFKTDLPSWNALDGAVRELAKRENRVEVWAIILGQVRYGLRSPLAPCDRILGADGHRGKFPAELVVKRVNEFEVKSAPQSPYEYGLYLYLLPRANSFGPPL